MFKKRGEVKEYKGFFGRHTLAIATTTLIGTIVGARYRARCNQLTDSQREKLDDEFMRLYYGDTPRQPARRR